MKELLIKYGFRLDNVSKIDEVNGTLYDSIHEKSGARLLFLSRPDENKTFAIGFKTIPTDDTGVFHIMEHAVLCGSKKFPVKDPFTELIKGSISTYITAFTSGDKTIYPVASKNDTAFYGMVDVYLDAVLHPLALENPFIFMQEGHRYELDENGELSVTGVVYNEMKGAYSSADEYADYLLTRRVSPGGTYSYDSGGNPDFITELTFEDFKAAHDKFYHPSNACVFLDGEVKLDEILPLIDSYLSEYDKRPCDFRIDDGEPPITEPLISTYPIEKEDDPTDKTRIYLCHNTFTHEEKFKNSALSLATEALADSNNAPLTKLILDTGLCESFTFFPTRSYSLNALNAVFIGVKDGKEDELIDIYERALGEILDRGIPMENLAAALDRREFRVRESDFGTYPAGMVYMSSCIEFAMLGEKPEDSLKYEDLLAFLREKLNTGYYTELLRESISTPRATLILHPDEELADKNEALTRERLAKISKEMTDEEKQKLRVVNEAFAVWQATPDTKETLSTIPSLTKEDLRVEPKNIPTEIFNEDGCEIINHPLHTGGISYPELFFDASDAPQDESAYIRLFTELITEWDTELGGVTEFRNKVKRHLGSFFMSPYPTDNGDDVKLYIVLRLSCLEANKDKALELIDEHLYKTLFNNRELLIKNIKQIYTASLESIVSRGDAFAMIRGAAKYSRLEVLNEIMFGYSYHAFLKDLSEHAEEKADEILKRFEKIRDRYFRRERLTVGITEQDGKEFAKRIISVIKDGGDKAKRCALEPLTRLNEGIAAPVTVSFAARSASLNDVGKDLYTGAFGLISSIASLEILWNEIRLKLGAYGTGFAVRSGSGSIECYSYRDPSPRSSVAFFGNIKNELDSFLDADPDLIKYIIGVIGSTDTVSTPRNDGSAATKRYLAGKTHKDSVRIRYECLEATNQELRRLSDIIGKAMENSTFTVVGPRDELEKIDNIDVILDI